MSLSTHVLNAMTGRPAPGVAVTLESWAASAWQPAAAGSTDADGRIGDLGSPAAGRHRITFDTGGYFAALGVASFYPEVSVVFEITEPDRHHHVPLLLSPYGYTTYRGS
ncbi:MAG TPA: hydroxyisourate hydrolase [Jatrophihabitans sp.]|nr:hydroxyisourate hydrolase [Jatrophihabitans sp.]